MVTSDPATQQAQEDIPKIRWVVMAKRHVFQGSKPVSAHQEAGQESRARWHRARLAVVGDRMWQEIGMLVPRTAAGS